MNTIGVFFCNFYVFVSFESLVMMARHDILGQQLVLRGKKKIGRSWEKRRSNNCIPRAHVIAIYVGRRADLKG